MDDLEPAQLDTSIGLSALPMPLHWHTPPLRWSKPDGDSLTITAGADTDLFVDPAGTSERLNAPCLLGVPDGDFLLSSRVTVGFATAFDAGVLLLHADPQHWAKLCFEYSPQRQPMIVSVVTRGRSDDSNACTVDGHQAWLRIARIGPAYAFHASTDGERWQFVRHFTLGPDAAPRVGFLAQSPTGAECTATFDTIRYSPRTLTDLRGGE